MADAAKTLNNDAGNAQERLAQIANRITEIKELIRPITKDKKEMPPFARVGEKIAVIHEDLQALQLGFLCEILDTLKEACALVIEDSKEMQIALSQTISLVADDVFACIPQALSQCSVDCQVEHLKSAIEHINHQDPEKRKEAGQKALKMLFPQDELETSEISSGAHQPNVMPAQQMDMLFFNHLAQAMEKRTELFANRIELTEKFCHQMNELAGSPVPFLQLKVAIIINQWGLSLLPNTTLEKKEQLADEEWALIKDAPIQSSALLEGMPHWRQAQQIVLECHERPDGKGYPYGLEESKICEGAQILAIVNAYIAMVRAKPYKQSAPVNDETAIGEINKHAGTQFSQRWVNIFNKAAKALLQ